MDPVRFDFLTRSLVASTSRRGLLGGLAAFAAALVGQRAAGAQVSQAQCGNRICYDRRTQTVDDVCADGCVCCVYPNGNSRCRPPQDCTGPGTVVSPPTTTTTSTTTPVPTCASGLADGAQCDTGMVCSGGQCTGNGFCTSPGLLGCGATDCALGGSRNSACVSTLEGAVTCIGDATCEMATPCTSSTDCQTGFVCTTGDGCSVCVPICDPRS